MFLKAHVRSRPIRLEAKNGPCIVVRKFWSLYVVSVVFTAMDSGLTYRRQAHTIQVSTTTVFDDGSGSEILARTAVRHHLHGRTGPLPKCAKKVCAVFRSKPAVVGWLVFGNRSGTDYVKGTHLDHGATAVASGATERHQSSFQSFITGVLTTGTAANDMVKACVWKVSHRRRNNPSHSKLAKNVARAKMC